ncbi:uncharacterized protein LOC135467051 [Liolophura sinensis]|uniref:uncharacterized protein LOC135467051 n=1 Tax=Liolophura sinensis TaxID=3198878 RepID=UPI00315837FC
MLISLPRRQTLSRPSGYLVVMYIASHSGQTSPCVRTIFKMKLLILSLAVLSCVIFTKGCEPPDCDRKDCGSCGNACCAIEIHWPAQTEDIYKTMMGGLTNGGPDSRYTFKGGYDLRKDKAKADFILQGWHTTLKNHYNDTLDFTLVPTNDTYSIVNAFSISQIATAYCDAGQNYKNIIALMNSFGVEYQWVVVHGCPQR